MSHETEKEKTTAAQPEQAAEAPETEAKTEAASEQKADKSDKKEKHHHAEAALQAKLEASEKKNAELKDQLLRTAAEYDNYRKRSQREADQKFNDGISHAVTQILSILDTLDMAANAACTDENYKKGVMMTLDKAAKALENLHGSIFRQHRNIEYTGIQNHVSGIVGLIDGNGDTLGIIRQLAGRIDDAAVIFGTFLGG